MCVKEESNVAAATGAAAEARGESNQIGEAQSQL
jgi:hypothetical protein